MISEAIELVLGARYIVDQRRVVAALVDTAARTLWRAWRGGPTTPPTQLSGPELVERVIAPSPALVRDYARHLGIAPDAYRHPATVPAHLFPQWTFPVGARALRHLPYPLARILNAGCRLQINAAIPAAAPLVVRAQLLDVKDDGRRVLLHERIITDVPAGRSAVVADLYAVAPTPTPKGRAASTRGNGSSGPSPAPSSRSPSSASDGGRVPMSARELARVRFGPRAGLSYAFLSGDFNPVHWARAYARISGFPTPILHGFALLARSMECLGRALFAGASNRMSVIDVRFKRPLVLGEGVEVGLYLDSRYPQRFYVADAPGVRPYLAGSFEARDA